MIQIGTLVIGHHYNDVPIANPIVIGTTFFQGVGYCHCHGMCYWLSFGIVMVFDTYINWNKKVCIIISANDCNTPTINLDSWPYYNMLWLTSVVNLMMISQYSPQLHWPYHHNTNQITAYITNWYPLPSQIW